MTDPRSEPPRRPPSVRTFLRLLLIQASWNERSLIGHGFAWSLAPLLKRSDPDGGVTPDTVLARHTEPFNSHPYLAGIAVGAVARAEQDGVDPEVIRRFKEVLRSPLGATGDALVWAGVLPICLLGALVLARVGASPVTVLASFLVVYNAFHLSVRWWGLRLGWTSGIRAGEALLRSQLRKHASRAILISGMLSGMLAGLAAAGWTGEVDHGAAWVAAGALALLAGYRWGTPAVRLSGLFLLGWFLLLTGSS